MARILIVDDEADLAMMITGRLKVWGHEVLTASNGPDGLAAARSERPDLILLDLMLPKLNGYEICHLLKQDAKFQSIPIIMLTARAQQSDRKLALESGANAYLAKPYEPQELRQAIDDLLKPSAPPSGPPPTSP